MSRKLDLLNKTLSYIAPKFTAERLAWQNYIRSSYDSGNTDRLNSGWTPINSTAELTNQGERDRIRARARDLERNSDIEEAIISTFERNVVGSGFQLQAKTDDEEFNKNAQELFTKWQKAKNCDISERFSFFEMQNLSIRRTKVDGGLLFIKNYESNGILPFCLQMREVDEIDESIFSYTNKTNDGNRIINGIEVDKYNRHVAYYIKQMSPDGLINYESKRIDAKNVIYLNRLKRPSQVREISELATTATRIRDINEFAESVSVKERILACLTVFIKKNNPGNGHGRQVPENIITNQENENQRKLGSGVITELAPGEDAQVINPNGQASNAKEFVMFQQRLAGAGQGLSYESTSRDYSQTNYSSARQGLLEDWKTYEFWQLIMIQKFLDEVYEEFIVSAVLSGKIQIKFNEFFNNKEKYLKHEWIASGWSWIDPLKEAKANEIALATGQATLEEILAGQGKDWKAVLAQRAKELEEMKKLGLDFTQSSDTFIIGDDNGKKTD